MPSNVMEASIGYSKALGFQKEICTNKGTSKAKQPQRKPKWRRQGTKERQVDPKEGKRRPMGGELCPRGCLKGAKGDQKDPKMASKRL